MMIDKTETQDAVAAKITTNVPNNLAYKKGFEDGRIAGHQEGEKCGWNAGAEAMRDKCSTYLERDYPDDFGIREYVMPPPYQEKDK